MNKPTGLIITADDFGRHPAINAAVERAHRDGVLTAASLMVGEAHVAEAVAIAQRNPKLRVGLHIALTEGRAVLPPAQIPDLVNADGEFPEDAMARDGARFFFLPWVRRQVAAEIRAQYEAFQATGLNLDHVNAHRHFHLHPTILSLMLSIGREFGLRAVRLPAEVGAPPIIAPALLWLRRALKKTGVVHNDQVAGLVHSGGMDEPQLLQVLAQLAPGVTEIYLHPATVSGRAIAEPMAGYRHADELAALLSPRVRAALDALNIPRGGFADLFGSSA
ncbi:MAG: hopanoid biosynthesis-associated protein HpnK [Pseudomonadota bacterium]